jgi:hypothetical protein
VGFTRNSPPGKLFGTIPALLDVPRSYGGNRANTLQVPWENRGVPIERTVQKFSSHDEAERAEREYYNSLSPEQRVEVLLELMNRARDLNDPASQRLERVYRIVKLKSS